MRKKGRCCKVIEYDDSTVPFFILQIIYWFPAVQSYA